MTRPKQFQLSWPPQQREKVLTAMEAWEREELALTPEESARIMTVSAWILNTETAPPTLRDALSRYMSGGFTPRPSDVDGVNEVLRIFLNARGKE